MRLLPILVASALVITAVLPALGAGQRLETKLTETKLANGLTVIIHEDHRTPTVTVNLWYDVGSKDDPPGRSGFAHLFEHLMLQGSKHVPEDAYFKFLEEAGATDRNASTSQDRTNYFETVPSNELPLALWLESDRLGFLLDHLDQRTLDNQRDVVKNERRQSYENRPYGFDWILLDEALYPPGHPYHRVTIGDPHELDAASLEDARAFFRTWYVPNNASLVIAGDVRPDEALALAKKYFEAIVARPLPARAAPPPLTLTGETRMDVAAGVDLARVLVAWPTPAGFAPGDAELDVLGRVLAHGESSRLRRRLVREQQIAESVSAYQDSGRLGSMFIVEATARPGHTADELLTLIDAEVQRLRDDPPTEAERARAVTGCTAQLLYEVERGPRRADAINAYRLRAGDAAFLPKDVDRYERVTADAVRAVVRALLPADRRVVEIVTPTKGAPIAGQVVRTATKGAR